MDNNKPKDRLEDISLPTPAGDEAEPAEVFAIRRHAGGWSLSRREMFGAGLALPAALSPAASAQTRKGSLAAAAQPVKAEAPEPAKLAHSALVTSLAYSPDGTLLATASQDRTIKTWSTADDQMRAILAGHSGPVEAIVFSRDGRLIVSASQDNTINVWVAATGELLKSYKLSGSASALASAADRDLVAAGTSGGEIYVIEPIESGTPQNFKGHARIDGLALSADGKYLISWYQKEALLWQLGGSMQKVQLPGHNQEVKAAAFSPEGSIAITGARDNKVRLWSVPAGTLMKTLEDHGDDVNSIAVLPDGRTFITASNDRTVRIWSLPDGKLLRTMAGHTGLVQKVSLAKSAPAFASLSENLLLVHSLPAGEPVLSIHTGKSEQLFRSLALSPDGRLACGGSAQGAVVVADAGAKRFRTYLVDAAVSPVLAPKETKPAHFESIKGILSTPNGQSVVSVAEDAMLKLWSVADRKPSAAFTLPAESGQMTLTPDGKVLAVACDDMIELFSLPDARHLQRLEGHISAITGLGAVGEALLISAGEDGAVRTWSLPDGKPSGLLHTLRRQQFKYLVHAPDGKYAVAGSESGPLHVWSLARGRYIGTLPSSDGRIRALELAADGETLAAAIGNETRLWSLRKLKVLASPSRERQSAGSLIFSRDSRTLLIAWGDELEWRSLPDGAVVASQTLENVTTLERTPDGSLAVSGHRDGSLKIWSMETRRQSAAIKMPNEITALVFVAGSSALIAGDKKGNMALWHLNPPEFQGWFADPGLTDITAPKPLNAHRGSVLGIAISKDGKRLASGGTDSLAKVWSLTERKLEALMEGHKNNVNAVALLANDNLMTASSDGTLRIWSVPKSSPEPAPAKTAAAKDLPKKPAASSKVLKAALPRGTVISTLADHKGSVQGIAVAQDGKVAATWTSTISRLWALPEGRQIKELNATEVTFAGALAAARSGASWSVMDMEGRELATNKENRLEAFTALPDGSAVLPAANGVVRFWLVPDLELAATIEELPNTVQRIAVSPDGSRLVASGINPGGLGVWVLPEGRRQAYLGGRSSSFDRIRISPDSLIVAAAKGGVIYLWSLADLRLLGRLNASEAGGVNQMEFTPDGRTLVCAHSQNAISLWDVTKPAFSTYLFDPAANQSDSKAISYNVYDQTTGRWITYTLPCGSPIPPGAVCVCNCVPGTGCSCVSVSRGGGGGFGGGRTCTCVPVHYWYPN